MFRARIYVIAFFLFFRFGFTQVKFKYGFEMGYGFAQKVEEPHEVSTNFRKDLIVVNRSNVSSILPGISADLLIKKHFRFGFGAQYQKWGSHYAEYRDGNDMLNQKKFQTYETIDQSFTSLCFPLTIGVTCKIWKLSPTFFVGTRPNYLLTGSYASKYTFDHDLDSLDRWGSYAFDPLENTYGSRFARRVVLQGIRTGVSLFIGDWIKVSYYRFVGGRMFYQIGGPQSCFGYSCDNLGHAVSITLYVPQKKKPTIECKLVHKKTDTPFN